MWKTIDEDTPRDRTAVWVLCDGHPYLGYCEPATPYRGRDMWVLKATVRRRQDGADDIVGVYVTDAAPTHWQPLPTPPAKED